jgi:hypothetical protein
VLAEFDYYYDDRNDCGEKWTLEKIKQVALGLGNGEREKGVIDARANIPWQTF